MKLTAILIVVACLQANAEVYSQNVTLSFRNAPLQKVFKEIKRQTGYNFLCTTELLDKAGTVDLEVKNISLQEALQLCFQKTPLTYTIVEKTIVIKQKEIVKTVTTAIPEPLADIPIKGRVTDENGNPLEGASVIIKGTNIGVNTDANGEFKIDVPENSSMVLVISYVGMELREINVKGKTTVAVTINRIATQQQEVVVIGYGTQKKSDITGSVSSVKTKDLEKTPAFRADQALQGRVAGVNVQNADAAPNANTVIRIRGANSINGGNDPLVVIDGMQGGSLNTLNPSEIESIEVLKDASATAIYGSRGANGVILVTTKRGKSGKPSITYNAYVTQNQVRKKLDVLDAEQYATTVNANREAFGLPKVFTDAQITDFKNNQGTNWQDAIFRKGITNNHQLSIGGSTDALSYYVSGNYLNNEGIIKNSSYSRYSLRSNLKIKATDKLSIGVNMFLSRENDHPVVQNTFAGQNAGSPLFSALIWAPVKKIYDDQGNYTMPGGGYGPNTNYNPVALAVEPIRDYFTNTMNVLGNVEYQIIPGLKLSVLGAYRNLNSEKNDYFNSKPTGAAGTEVAAVTNDKFFYLQNTNMLTYEKKINKHDLKFTGVAEQQYEESSGSYAGSIGFAANSVTYNNLALGNNPQIPYSYRTSRSLMSYMGRVNYGFDSRYLITLTARADGSSVFGANNKWGYFPSAALGWNISNEAFMQKLKKTINNLKLRASYGIIGNQAILPYQSLATLNTSYQYPINGTNLSTGVGLGEIENPNLKWEKTSQTNVGMDVQLLKGRLDITVDYYKKKTSDLLLRIPLPMSGGGSGSVLRNVGEVENNGFEVYVGGKPVVQNLLWETGITLALNKNKVLSLFEGNNEILLGNPGLPGFTKTVWLEVGQPLGLFRGYKFAGVWKQAEVSNAALYGAVPGDAKYEDVNKDGKIDESDIVNIGNAQPKIVFGWNNTLTYKNIDLNIFINGVQGNKIYNISRVRFESSSSDGDATSTKILNRWTPQNENTDVPSFKGSNDGRANSSRWMEDGSFVRLKNISLGYKLGEKITSKLKLNSARVYISGNNLVTLTKYTGFDPEVSIDVDSRAGVDLASYPSQKSFTIGLDIKF